MRTVSWVVWFSAFATCLISGAQANSKPRFQGRMLVVACDTDMLPSAYVDGKLGPDVGSDVLSVLRLDQPGTQLPVSSVPVSNSVTGPPAAVAVSPDGHYAIVVETQGPRPARKPDATLDDLAPGRTITVIDLSVLDKPTVTQRLKSYDRGVSVAVNARGDLVAVAFSPKNKTAPVPLVMYRFAKGQLSEPVEPVIPGFSDGDKLSDVEFLPGRDVIGVLFTSDSADPKEHPRLALYQFRRSQGSLQLRPWGNRIDLGTSPSLVRFTSDSHFAIVNTMDHFGEGRGAVTSIRLAATIDAEGHPKHAIASRADAGVLPEGMAVSPNGRWVATVNLETSPLPLSDPGQQFYSSISLFRLDPLYGKLDRIGDFPFDGMLPEAIVFDNSNSFIAASSFSRFNDARAGGSIKFWRILDKSPTPKSAELLLQEDSVPTSRGPQSMAIVR